jgi:hypothetical protein
VATLFKGGTFDLDACEATGVKACRGKFDVASGKLDKTPICPSCLDPGARGAVADGAAAFLEQLKPSIYCAGTTPLP